MLNFEKVINTLKVKQEITLSNEFKSKHWKKFIDNKFLKINTSTLENFRNNGFSDGLDNARLVNEEYLKNYFDKFKYKIDELEYNYEEIIKKFDKKNIGKNKIFIKEKEQFIDTLQIDHMYLYILIDKLILRKTKKIQTILEIGGGYGDLARIILLQKNFKYFFVDLKENLLLQIYFLNMNCPDLRIYINNRDALTKQDLNDHDLFFFTPEAISQVLNDVKIDLFINSSSFAEMEKKTIKMYFEFIQKRLNIGGYLFNSNRYFKDSVGQKIRLCDYPYDKFWEVKYSENIFMSRRLHCLITERTINKNEEIRGALQLIEQLTKNHEYPKLIPVWLMKIVRIFKKK